jgi:hypothetical protein
MRPVVVWGLACLLAVAAGCGGTTSRTVRGVSQTPPKPVDSVDAIDLWAAPPAAINWDDQPGPDGVQVSVFLYQSDHAEPVLVKGTIEFLMFEGRKARESLATAKPLRMWSYGVTELATQQVRGPAGWGYAFQLGWGKDVPQSAVITLIVRYVPAAGAATYSEPMVISVAK